MQPAVFRDHHETRFRRGDERQLVERTAVIQDAEQRRDHRNGPLNRHSPTTSAWVVPIGLSVWTQVAAKLSVNPGRTISVGGSPSVSGRTRLIEATCHDSTDTSD